MGMQDAQHSLGRGGWVQWDVFVVLGVDMGASGSGYLYCFVVLRFDGFRRRCFVLFTLLGVVKNRCV